MLYGRNLLPVPLIFDDYIKWPYHGLGGRKSGNTKATEGFRLNLSLRLSLKAISITSFS
jgi:hypothetical protein